MATFSKKHYEALADLMARQGTLIPDVSEGHDDMDVYAIKVRRAEWVTTVFRMAETFERDNSRFDRGRFLKACGL